VEEIGQDVFLQAWWKIGQLADVRRFSGWLMTMADRMAINRARRGRKEMDLGPSFDYAAVRVTDEGPAAVLEAKESRASVRDGLRRVKEPDCKLLLDAYVEELPLKEIAAKLGKPVGTVKSRLYTARLHLARK